MCFPADILISSHFSTIGGPITTLFNGLSINLQVFDLIAVQTFPPNQTELGDVGEPEEDMLGDNNFPVLLLYNA